MSLVNQAMAMTIVAWRRYGFVEMTFENNLAPHYIFRLAIIRYCLSSSFQPLMPQSIAWQSGILATHFADNASAREIRAAIYCRRMQ